MRRPVARGVALLLGVLIAAGCESRKPEPQSGPPPPDIRDEIADLLHAGANGLGVADTSRTAETWGRLRGLYAERHNRPAWSNGKRLRRQAEELIEAIRATAAAGLDPRDYDLHRLERLAAQSENRHPTAQRLLPRTLARFDVLASHSLLRVASHLRQGRLPRSVLDPDWQTDTLGHAGWETVQRSIGRDPAPLFAGLEPKPSGYRSLREALARHREIAASGGWGEIPAGPPLKLGARGPRVTALARRLAVAGDLPAAAVDSVFDSRLERAVGSLQARHGIPVSGVLGEATRAALNVPVERRIRQIELNLERWRWLPDTLGRRRVEVNIPAYRLEIIREGRPTRAMRVVVGKRKSPTPIFSDRITYLEANPTWTLPPSVVAKEIVPMLKRDRDYLEKNHMRVISIADAKRDTVDPRQVPWKDAGSDSFLYLVVQDAGPDNPLGQIKLMCPNEYDVYLHDTSMRSRFTVAVRDYSHGCVRVEHAVELADSLLGVAPGDSSALDSLVASGAWRRVRLPESVPVHFLYWTAWIDANGRLHYRDDVYGLDERLDQALRTRALSEFALNPGVEISPFWAAAEARARAAALKRTKR